MQIVSAWTPHWSVYVGRVVKGHGRCINPTHPGISLGDRWLLKCSQIGLPFSRIESVSPWSMACVYSRPRFLSVLAYSLNPRTGVFACGNGHCGSHVPLRIALYIPEREQAIDCRKGHRARSIPAHANVIRIAFWDPPLIRSSRIKSDATIVLPTENGFVPDRYIL